MQTFSFNFIANGDRYTDRARATNAYDAQRQIEAAYPGASNFRLLGSTNGELTIQEAGALV